jgi:hypothetical protein
MYIQVMFGVSERDIVRVGLYWAVALVCYRAWRHEVGSPPEADLRPISWLVLGAFFSGLGLIEVLNLGQGPTDWLRTQARVEGWYADRRSLQSATIWLLLAGVTIASVAIVAYTPRPWRRYLGPYLASLGLAAFLAVRAVSLHRVDAVLNAQASGSLRWGDFSELVAAAAILLLVAVSANQPFDLPNPKEMFEKSPRHPPEQP